MGDCYSVQLGVKFKRGARTAARDAINRYILERSGTTEFSLREYAKQGVRTDNLQGCIGVFLANWEGNRMSISRNKDGFTVYDNAFNASYGWGDVLDGFFYAIAPFLKDGSWFDVDAEETHINLIIKDGEVDGN